jgi:hypothetical protein
MLFGNTAGFASINSIKLTSEGRERIARYRAMQAERARMAAVGNVLAAERLDGEIRTLLRENLEASRRNRPVRIPTESELVIGLEKAVELAVERGDTAANVPGEGPSGIVGHCLLQPVSISRYYGLSWSEPGRAISTRQQAGRER